MNRILQALLPIFIFGHTAFGQGSDNPATSRGSDTITISGETDTTVVFRKPDSVAPYQKSDSIPLYISGDIVQTDSAVTKEAEVPRSPSKAIMYALVLPGLGQGYNHKYYKIPIVWAALGGVGYAIVYNTRRYRESAYDYAKNPDNTNERYLQFWRRNMELSYIGLIAVYALQVVDAYVDAQLYGWDVNEDLSLRVTPSLQPLMAPASLTGQSFGLTCSFNLKGR
jgi:hypothetical protein